MDELVKESLDTLLIQYVHSVWLKKLESRSLSQIAQIIINLEYFQGACTDFEQLLTDSRYIQGLIDMRALDCRGITDGSSFHYLH